MVAWKFAERGCRISWWGDGEPGASRVAAGMFNPVSFRRVVEVWNASAHVANMRSTLQAMEEAFGMQGALVHNVPVVKVFANDAYRQTWDDRWATDHGVTQWAERGQPAEALDIMSLNAPYGVGKVQAAGWVDVPALLDAMEAHVATHHTLVDCAWRVDDGLPDGADVVVDCRGVGAVKELSEVGLKVNPNHGDVLTLSTEAEALQTQGHNVNNGKWLLPMRQQDGRQWWRLGATYSWDKPTRAACPSGPSVERPHGGRLPRRGEPSLGQWKGGGAPSRVAPRVPRPTADGGAMAWPTRGRAHAQRPRHTGGLGGPCSS